MKWLESGVFLLVILSLSRAAPAPKADDDESLRLPKNSLPLSYDIALKTNIHAGQRAFTGTVKIEIEIRETSDYITLHNRELAIDIASVKLTSALSNELTIEVTEDPAKEFLHIESVSQSLLPGEKYTLEISYSGMLQLGTSGFYRSSYTVNGLTRWLAATQFESTNARYAFPCYDEPEFKATFKLSITHHSSYEAISNEKETPIPNDDDTVTTTFNETPKMSTYLLGFIVSDFGHITNEEGLPENAIVHKIYARKDDVERTRYALNLGYELLNELARYAKYDYELEKMTSAAVPDFGAGAMENWGLITYKEQYLIGDENSHPRDILEIQKTIAHELGHQFFGNVVTCKWWDQIWLNEGFATLFEYLLVENTHPELRFRHYFNVQKVQNAFRSDALETTRAMLSYAETPSDISGLFDRIAYDKSGSVIRMFQNAVGEDIFRDSLSLYLNDNEHEPVTSEDLFKAFETTISNSPDSPIGFDFTRAFSSWETQKGFPVIHVSTNIERAAFTITQERYYAATETRVENDPRSWYIPMNYATADAPTFDDTSITDFFEDGVATKEIPLPTGFDNSKWFIFNKQQLGFYRVNYELSNWNALIDILNSPNFEDIHVLNRAQIVDDALNLAFDGYLDFNITLRVLNYMEHETDYIPWRGIVNSLDKLDYIMKGNPLQTKFRKFVNKLVKRMFNLYGVEEKPTDTVMDKFGRELAMDWACRTGDRECLTKASSLLKTYLADGLPDSLEITVICNGLQGTNVEANFAAVHEKMIRSTDQSKRLRMIDGLTCVPNKTLAFNLLETVAADSDNLHFRSHERLRILNSVLSRSSAGFASTAEYLTTYYNDLVAIAPLYIVDSVIISMSNRIANYDDQVVLTDLLTALGDKISDAVKDQAMKNIDNNKEFIASGKFQDILIYISEKVAMFEEIETQLRLPKSSIPLHYKLHVDVRNIHTGDRNFEGEVEIDALTTAATNYIQIHSKTQVINDLHVFEKNGVTEVPVFNYVLYAPSDTLTIYFEDELSANHEVLIRIKYSTIMPTAGTGFYQTSYVMNGERRYVGSTQFQPTGGRYTFPHYDEPEFKAVFELAITHDASVKAIANTWGTDHDNDDGTFTTTFLNTPLMSSYLLAFVVSDFEHVSNEVDLPEGEVVHRVWVRPDSVPKAWYALENSAKVLKELENYVQFPFELPKVDSAAIPNKGGAMENWGMVTYWETAMIYEEKYEDISHAFKLSGVDVIAHELAHQFFGDSVTCKWWDQTWLNEGFATLFEFHITDILYPAWNTRHFFNLRKLQNAFRSDSRNVTRPMTSPVESLSEISNAFDTIAYDKSGSVLRMFQYTLGEEIFRDSLKHYLEINDHTSVTSDELVAAFTEIMAQKGFTAFDFETAFRTWETQAGYPLIHVTLNNGQFQVTQERFFTNKTIDSGDTSSWYIPLNFGTPASDFEDTSITNYFVAGDASLTIAAPSDASQWFIFNKQQLGYYRVNYDAANWNALINTLNSANFEQIHVLNRVQLIDDAVNLAAGGYLDYQVLFDILGYLEHETEYTPWFVADRFIATLYTTFGPKNEYLNTLLAHLSAEFYYQYKVPENGAIPIEETYERYGRELATKIACNAGNQLCLEDANGQNYRMINDDVAVPKGLENVIYCNGFRYGAVSQADWVKMWQMMQNTDDATFKSRAISALGCTSDTELLQNYMESSTAYGRTFNYTVAQRRNVLGAVLNSFTGLEVALEFLRVYEADILEMYEYSLEDLATAPARTIKTQHDYEMFMAYFNTLPHLEIEARDRIIAIVDNNLNAQTLELNVAHMDKIEKLLIAKNLIPEPTDAPITDGPTTTEDLGTTVPQTTPDQTTDPTTDPTIGPSTVPSTNEPSTTEAVTETTTAGVSAIGIQIVTLLASFFVAFALKF